MTIKEKRILLTKNVPNLISKAYELGYEPAIHYVFRCDTCKTGKTLSLHKLGLAIDIILYKDGVPMKETEKHRELGEYWKSLNPLFCWGGRFQDGNHYSVKHDGFM